MEYRPLIQRSHVHLPFVCPPPCGASLDCERSFWVAPGRCRVRSDIVRFWDEQQWDLWFCAVLPLLEHGLRRIWVFLLGAESSSFLVCQSDKLFTTLNIFLEPNDGMSIILGHDTMELARDLFQRIDGPRVRDIISHGATEAFAVPCEFRNNVASLWMQLMASCAFERPVSFDTFVHRPVYHPGAILQARLVRSQDMLQQLGGPIDDAQSHFSPIGQILDNLLAAEMRHQPLLQGQLPLVDYGALELIHRSCARLLDSVMSIAVILLPPRKSNIKWDSNGAKCASALGQVLLCRIWQCASEMDPVSPTTTVEWLECCARILGTALSRIQCGKWFEFGGQLALWFGVEQPVWTKVKASMSHRERSLLQSCPIPWR